MEQDEAARVRALGEIAAEFDLDAIRVRTGDTEIEIVRRDPALAAAQHAVYAMPPPVPAGGLPGASIAGRDAAASPPSARGKPPGARAVTAPVVGVFYRSSSPDAEPYVEVGARVASGQTLCILEAMKLMNEITSDWPGVVSNVLVENGALVTLGQELFWIEP